MMRLYDSLGPNPRVVRMFAAERGVHLERVKVDVRGGENRRLPYLAINPAGQLPALVLENGTVLTEIVAICEYLDEVATAGPSLIGATPLERAESRMWARRVDLKIAEPLTNAFRFSVGLKMFQDRVHCIPQAADDLKATVQENLAWFDPLITGRDFLCGNRLSLADILLFAFLDFGTGVGQPLPTGLPAINAHFERMKARASAAA